MPDLLTHTVLTYVAAVGARRRLLVLAMAGAVLPDLASSGSLLVLQRLSAAAGRRLPDWSLDGFVLFHAPLPITLLCWVLALYLPADRIRGFLALALGAWLHIGLDLLQSHLGPAVYYPLYPLVRRGWEAGWIGTEASIRWLPLSLSVALGAWFWRRRARPVLE